jgi:iron complex outermembrane receptor protein
VIRLTFFAVALISASSFSYADEGNLAAARQHYANGKRAYDLGHFDEAAREYELAYRAKDDPALLYNLGQAHRLAGNLQQAVLSYKAYLRNVPDAPNRAEVEARIRELQTAIDSTPRPAAPTETHPSTTPAAMSPASSSSAVAVAHENASRPAAPAKKRRALMWGFIVGGAAIVIGVGVGLGVGLSSRDIPPTPTFGAGTVH